MIKRNKVIIGSVSASMILAMGLSFQLGNYSEIVLAKTLEEKEDGNKKLKSQDEEMAELEVGAIQLSPGMYIPEKTSLINQEVTKEDVLKTINMEAIKLMANVALAEIDAGIVYHLGYKEENLAPTQVQLYNDNVASYSKKVKAIAETTLEEHEIEVIVVEFSNWVTSYKTAIANEIKLAKEAELKEEESNDYAPEKQTNEVIKGVDHSPVSSDLNTKHISYGIPELGDQYLTYEPYTAITAKTTPHYRLQTLAKTDDHGYRIYQDAVSVALGSAYGTTIGTLYDIKFLDGKIMRAILGDNKSDKHTDSLKQYRDATGTYDGSSGNIVEIIFDTTNYANMQAVNKKINSDYSGNVVSITKVGMAEGFGQ